MTPAPAGSLDAAAVPELATAPIDAPDGHVEHARPVAPPTRGSPVSPVSPVRLAPPTGQAPPARRTPASSPAPRGHDVAAIAPDAALPAEARSQAVELDAAVEPAPAPGHIVVRNDLWCNVWIDGVDRGNRRNEPIEVPAGHHVVRCVNPVGSWTKETDVAPATTRTLTGTLLRELEIRLDVDATIDGKPFARGAVVRLKPGIVEVVAGGKKRFITFRDSCTLRDSPELGCYL